MFHSFQVILKSIRNSASNGGLRPTSLPFDLSLCDGEQRSAGLRPRRKIRPLMSDRVESRECWDAAYCGREKQLTQMGDGAQEATKCSDDSENDVNRQNQIVQGTLDPEEPL